MSVSSDESEIVRAGRTVLIRSPKYPEVEDAWFDPTRWGAAAEPVNAGGRGGAWFVEAGQSKLVLRHYLRGGLVARFSRRTYVFRGLGAARSFAEFRLLEQLSKLDLPVPAPVAAMVRRVGCLRYQAAILVERIDGAVPLPEHPRLRDEELWQSVGAMIARFHDQGLEHVDLNADNLLVSGTDVFLIDFDRCRLHGPEKPSANWKQKNLDRLQRSIQKRCSELSDDVRAELWEALKAGYASGE